MTTAIKHQIIEAVKEYMDSHNMSQSKLSKISKINEGYLSKMLNSEFNYDAGKNVKKPFADKYFETLAELVDLRLKKSYWEIKQTPQLISGISILEDAKEFGETRIIIGETGCGKTQLIDLFAKKNPLDVYKITVGSSDNLGDLLDKIVDALGITPAKTKSKKIREIIKKLKSIKADGGKPMLILDESEYMKVVVLCMIKELYDALKGICSIVLVGTHQLKNNLETLKKRNKAGIPQFYRRVKFGIRVLPKLGASYQTPFVEDIKERDLKNFLKRNCENYGELHDVLVPCRRESERLQQPLTLELVKTVLSINEVA